MSEILIIAGTPALTAEIQAMLEDPALSVVVAHSEEEARQAIERGRRALDVVLLDTTMPSDPLALLRWIKERPETEHLEVILQSTTDLSDEIRQSISLGAYYHLTKPVEPTRLQALVRSALTSRALQRSLSRKAAETEDCFRLMATGRFEIQRPAEAELLAAHLGSACGDPQKGIGILELLVNGIEHGNLGVGYEEKTRLLAAGSYEEEIERRLDSEAHRHKRVTVHLERNGDSLDLLISDSGPGFDYQRYQTLDQERFFDSHGRGVLLATATVDVEYLEPGNRVRVRLPLRENGGCEGS